MALKENARAPTRPSEISARRPAAGPRFARRNIHAASRGGAATPQKRRSYKRFDARRYGEEGVSGLYLLFRRAANIVLACIGKGHACRKVPSMSKVNATLQVLRNRSQLAEDLDGGTMDLFLEITPVADFSATCYWRLTRVSRVALDYALPRVRDFVAARTAVLRQRSQTLENRDDDASLPALRRRGRAGTARRAIALVLLDCWRRPRSSVGEASA